MRLHVYDVALRVPFRGLSRRSGILLRGPAGWAEWSPFPEYGDDEAAAWLRAALEAAELGHPGAVRDSIEVNGIVPALAPADAARPRGGLRVPQHQDQGRRAGPGARRRRGAGRGRALGPP